jgi:hypothetical protein
VRGGEQAAQQIGDLLSGGVEKLLPKLLSAVATLLGVEDVPAAIRMGLATVRETAQKPAVTLLQTLLQPLAKVVAGLLGKQGDANLKPLSTPVASSKDKTIAVMAAEMKANGKVVVVLSQGGKQVVLEEALKKTTKDSNLVRKEVAAVETKGKEMQQLLPAGKELAKKANAEESTKAAVRAKNLARLGQETTEHLKKLADLAVDFVCEWLGPKPGCLRAGTATAGVDGWKRLVEQEAGDQVRIGDGSEGEAEAAARTRWRSGDEWRLLVVRVRLDYGAAGVTEATLLRERDWLESQGAVAGGVLWLDLKEQGVVGWARVEGIAACPRLPEPVAGCRLVTGTFRHSRAVVCELRVEGESEALGITPRHPVWSEDRQEWVAAQELQVGERLSTLRGEVARVQGVVLLRGEESVYNIEVDGDHCYRVGQQGVLVHNNSTDCYNDLCDVVAKVKSGSVSEYILKEEFKKTRNYPLQLACRGLTLIDEFIKEKKKGPTRKSVAVALVCNFKTGRYELWISTTYDVNRDEVHPIQKAIAAIGDPRYRFIPPKLKGQHGESSIAEEAGDGAYIIGIAATLDICRGCQGEETPTVGPSLPKGVEFLSPIQGASGAAPGGTCD